MQIWKHKKLGAQKGYKLLKQKADALKKAFNEIMKRVVETKKRMGAEYRECQIKMMEANFAAGDFGVSVRDEVKATTKIRLTVFFDNIAGVGQPHFILKGLGEDTDSMLGMNKGGQAIMRAKDRYEKYLQLLVQIATFQAQYVAIEKSLKETNRRVNALEFVVIPKIEWTVKWIEGELDEIEREDFYRIKCVQDKKQIAKEVEARELAAKMQTDTEDESKKEHDLNADTK